MITSTIDESFNAVLRKFHEVRKPYAIATVIAVRGSASARPGSRAIIDESGRNVWGWVGGGCAESFVGREAVLALSENRTRIVQADLDDEVFGLGMPCGGVMDVFIEPRLNPECLVVEESPELEPVMAHLARSMGFDFEFRKGAPLGVSCAALERGVLALALAVARARGLDLMSLRDRRNIAPDATPSLTFRAGFELLIMGSSRITEELARLALIVKWPVRVYGSGLDRVNYPLAVTLQEAAPGYTDLQVDPGSAVIVASHHKGDHEFIAKALGSKAAYVGLIASEKRSRLVFEYLENVAQLGSGEIARVHAPAGLDLQCRNPQEIALSCVAHVIGLAAGQDFKRMGSN